MLGLVFLYTSCSSCAGRLHRSVARQCAYQPAYLQAFAPCGLAAAQRARCRASTGRPARRSAGSAGAPTRFRLRPALRGTLTLQLPSAMPASTVAWAASMPRLAPPALKPGAHHGARRRAGGPAGESSPLAARRGKVLLLLRGGVIFLGGRWSWRAQQSLFFCLKFSRGCCSREVC